MENVEKNYMPVKYLSEFAYCPRLGYLEWVESEYADNEYTLNGTFKHRRVNQETTPRVSPDEQIEESKIHARSVFLSSDELGLTGRIDIIEKDDDKLVPVEYKRGKIPHLEEKYYDSKAIQLCAYALLLKENAYQCDHGILYYTDSKKRVEIKFTDTLIQTTKSCIEAFRKVADSGEVPAPLEDSNKCFGCSLVGICLPDETAFLRKPYEKTPKELRRLVPARDDSLPVYVNEQGTHISKSGELLAFKTRSEGERKIAKEVRLIDISQLCIFGNVQISTQAIRELCAREIPICYFSYGGLFYGITHGHPHKNVVLRLAQYNTYNDASKRLELSKQIVFGKIRNSRTLIRRNHPEKPSDVLSQLEALSNQALKAHDLQQLLGIEGLAARVYYSAFPEMLKDKNLKFEFTRRNRRPPKDPVNALLSFAYAMLVKDLTITIYAVGLDPYVGFYHQVKYGKPSLALDLAEEFRPLIADSVVMTMINNGEVTENDFVKGLGSVTMKGAARTKLIAAYERRMETLIKHPIFGYSISYRRVLEVQTRLLARFLTGEIPKYNPFCTR